jgi:hypothetical protein
LGRKHEDERSVDTEVSCYYSAAAEVVLDAVEMVSWLLLEPAVVSRQGKQTDVFLLARKLRACIIVIYFDYLVLLARFTSLSLVISGRLVVMDTRSRTRICPKIQLNESVAGQKRSTWESHVQSSRESSRHVDGGPCHAGSFSVRHLSFQGFGLDNFTRSVIGLGLG